jgi:hypothetical protein
MLDRIGFRLVAQMPFSGKVRRVAVLFEVFGNRRSLFAEKILVARRNHDGKRRANRDSPCDERSTTRRTACLSIPTGKSGSFFGHLIDIRCRMAQGLAASAINAEIIPSGVVGHKHDNVGFLLGPGGLRADHSKKCGNCGQNQSHFLEQFHKIPFRAQRTDPFNNFHTVRTPRIADQLRFGPSGYGHFTVRVCLRELSLETGVEKQRKRAASRKERRPAARLVEFRGRVSAGGEHRWNCR